jgi:hypothetical protein
MSDFHEKDLIAADIEGYLEKYRGKELCRFVAIGSVDDGKSTLIGRLLYDTGMVFEDQLARSRRASASRTAASTSRCSPTGSPPSASRASPSTWPTATSPPRSASSSSPTRRGTCSTRATWGKRTRVKSIVALAADPHLQEAFAPMAITLTLTDEIDITRGDVLAHPGHSLHISKLIAATIVWMDDAPSSADKTYLFKHTNSVVKGQLVQLHHRLDLERLTEDPDPPHLGLNDIGRATIRLDRPLIMTPYRENRSLGAFIIIDRLTNATVAAGIIEADAADASLTPRHLADTLTTSSRAQRFRQHPTLLLLQGPDASEVARSLERALTERDHLPFVLDADALPPTGTLADTLPPTAALLCDRVGLLTLCPIALPPSLTPQTLQASLPRSRVITAHLAAAPSHTDSPSDWYLSACHPDAACAQILDRMRQHHLLR